MPITHLTSENFEKETSTGPVVIDFWASWCGPCQMMGPVFEKLSEEYEGKLKFCKLDTEDQPDVTEKFEVRGIPSLVFLKDGKEVERIIGFAPKEMMRAKFQDVLAKISG